jgi:hypothetical protein
MHEGIFVFTETHETKYFIKHALVRESESTCLSTWLMKSHQVYPPTDCGSNIVTPYIQQQPLEITIMVSGIIRGIWRDRTKLVCNFWHIASQFWNSLSYI